MLLSPKYFNVETRQKTSRVRMMILGVNGYGFPPKHSWTNSLFQPSNWKDKHTKEKIKGRRQHETMATDSMMFNHMPSCGPSPMTHLKLEMFTSLKEKEKWNNKRQSTSIMIINIIMINVKMSRWWWRWTYERHLTYCFANKLIKHSEIHASWGRMTTSTWLSAHRTTIRRVKN